MRSVLLLFVATACGSSQPPPSPPAPPVPTSEQHVEERPPTCADAAFGIDASTKGLRPADQELVPAVRTKCLAEGWSRAAIECFAKLRSDSDVYSCVTELTDFSVDSLIAELKGGTTDPAAALAEVKQRLAGVAVGIATCDQFVQEVARVMDCERLALDDRILLGTETAEAWSISTARLTIADKTRIAGVCGKSLDDLHKHAAQQSC